MLMKGHAAWVAGVILVVIGSACRNRDAEIEETLKKVAEHKATHVHYPVFVRANFKERNPVSGVDVDVYGYFSHILLMPQEYVNGFGEAVTESKLTDTLVAAIAVAAETEKSNPAPKILPTGPDWKHTSHPPLGSYEVDLSVGPDKQRFTIKPSTDSVQTSKDIQDQVRAFLSAYVPMEIQTLRAGKVPPGFAVSVEGYEPVKFDRHKRNDPYQRGLPLLVSPIDKAAAIRNLTTPLDKAFSVLKSQGQSQTNVSILGPVKEWHFPVSVSASLQDPQLQSVLKEISSQIDSLNSKAQSQH
jgi:hypothetical protein